jgi:hypothetical protein
VEGGNDIPCLPQDVTDQRKRANRIANLANQKVHYKYENDESKKVIPKAPSLKPAITGFVPIAERPTVDWLHLVADKLIEVCFEVIEH